MRTAIFEPDLSGTLVGSSFVFASARDFAIFGQLFLQNGVWENDQILPAHWVNYSVTPTPGSNGTYGAQWWLLPSHPVYPKDTFFANGYNGQTVIVIPSKELVIVRLGLDVDKNTPTFIEGNEHLYRSIEKGLIDQKL